MFDFFCEKIIEMVDNIVVIVIGLIFLFIKCKIYCVLCFFYVDKDFCEYFEICIYCWIIDIYSLLVKIIDVLVKFDFFSGVDIEVKF